MNAAKVKKLAEHIKDCHAVVPRHRPQADEFNTCFTMKADFLACGAPACLAGHTLVMEGNTRSTEPSINTTAQEILVFKYRPKRRVIHA